MIKIFFIKFLKSNVQFQYIHLCRAEDAKHRMLEALVNFGLDEHVHQVRKSHQADDKHCRLPYYGDNAEVMMELEGIDLMFSDQKVKPKPVKEYREYMKERKKKAKGKGSKWK